MQVRGKATTTKGASAITPYTLVRPAKPTGVTGSGSKEISGLTPNTTYEYSTNGTDVADTLTSNAAGVLIMPNEITGYYVRVKAVDANSFASEWSDSIVFGAE